MKTITKEDVLHAVHSLYQELERPVNIADLKSRFRIVEKRDSSRRQKGDSRVDRIERALWSLFNEEKISRSESLIRIENYPTSPYSTIKKTTTSNVYFHAPYELADSDVRFSLNGKDIDCRFVSHEFFKGLPKPITKKEMVLDVMKNSTRALSTPELLECINEKYKAYDVSTRERREVAMSALSQGVLQPLMKYGLKRKMVNQKYVWFFTEEQFQKYKEFYIESDSVLRLARELVKSRKCVPITRLLSELQMSPREARSRLRAVASSILVKINNASADNVDLEVPDFKRDSFLEWLGFVVPQKNGKGYESMLVDLDSDWKDELKKQIQKSIKRIGDSALSGIFYEKLVARLFDMLCTSEQLQGSQLSRYMIPFVFRSDRVTNVWITMESGRRSEFDVLLRGTFTAFNSMAEGKSFLDIVVPIESKFRMVEPEHVLAFEDKIRGIFGSEARIIPIMIGLAWSDGALEIAKRFGILTVYFTAINNLIREMTGTKYRIQHEWKRFEQLKIEGKLSNETLREQLSKGEYKFLFEQYIQEKLNPS